MQSHGAAEGTQSEFAGSRWDILQDILRGYPAGYKITYEDILQDVLIILINILQGYLMQDILT